MTYSPEQTAEMQTLYLELLARGKNERQIDEVENMASWGTRYSWRNDATFLTQCQIAQAHGAEYTLMEAEKKLDETIIRAEDEACPPQLPPLVKELMSHARWKAKCFSKKYSDKQDINLGGQADNPVKLDGKIEIVHVKPAP